jgi:hypothetical protein
MCTCRKRTIKNLEVIVPNIKKNLEDIKNHPEVITAAIQTILRKFEVKDDYGKIEISQKINRIWH